MLNRRLTLLASLFLFGLSSAYAQAPTFANNNSFEHIFAPGVTASVALPAASGATSYSLTPSDSIPSGLSFNSSTRALSGRPAAGAVSVQLTLRAQNSSGTASKSVIIIVRPDVPVPIGVGITQALINTVDHSYSVQVDARPASDVTVDINLMLNLVEPIFAGVTWTRRLTFTPANWNTPQTVQIRGTEVFGAGVIFVIHTVNFAGREVQTSQGFYHVTAEPAITVSPTTLRVAEGGTATYSVVLEGIQFNDTGTLVITPTSSDTTKATVNPSTLTFTLGSSGNWNSPQTVTVTGKTINDADALNDTLTISHSAGDHDSGFQRFDPSDSSVVLEDRRGSVALTVLDSDGVRFTDNADVTHIYQPGVAITPLVLPAAAGTGTFTYALTPTSDIPAGLSFDAATRTLSGTPTAGAVVASLTYTVTDAANNTGSIAVTLITRPEAAITGLTASLTNTMTNAYTTKLDARPASDVTVDISLEAQDGALVSNLSASPSTLTFTPANWNTPRTVNIRNSLGQFYAGTIAVRQDITIGGHLTHRITESYSVQQRASIVVPSTLTVDEGGTATYSVVLAGITADDTTDYTITPASSDTAIATVGGALTFRRGSYDTPQSVTVTALTIGDTDTLPDSVTITHTAGDHNSLFMTTTPAEDRRGSVAVTVADADVLQFPAGTTVPEQSFRPGRAITPVTLPAATSGTGTRTYTLTRAADIPAGLSFDAASRRISGTPAAGAVIATLTYTVTDSVGDSATLPVTIVIRPEVELMLPSMTHGTSSTVYTVALDAAPDRNVRVDITAARDFISTIGGDGLPIGFSLSPTSLTFTPDNWNTPRRIIVDAPNPQSGQFQFTHTIHFAGASHSLTRFYVAVYNTEVSLSSTTLIIPEGGSASYTFAFVNAPTRRDPSTVVVTPQVVGDGADAVTISAPLNFTHGGPNDNTAVPQTFIINAAAMNDDDSESFSVTIVHAVTVANFLGVGGALERRTVVVTIVDEDATATPAFAVGAEIAPQVFVPGATQSATFPAASGGSGALTYALRPLGRIPFGLSFDAATRTLSGTAPADAQAARLDYVVTDAAGASATLPVRVIVRPEVSVTFAADERTNTNANIYTVALDTELDFGEVRLDVELMFNRNEPVLPGFVADKSTLTFLPDNWNTPQTVILGGGGLRAGTMYVNHVVNFAGMETHTTSDTYTVVAQPSLVVSPHIVSVAEGGTATYTVFFRNLQELSAAKTFSVTPVSSDPARLSLSGALTFIEGGDNANWRTPQTVTITGLADDDSDSNNITITHTLSANQPIPANRNGSVTATVIDTDALAPDFGTASVATQVYTPAQAITALTLPAATGGSGVLTYALTPSGDIPAGLSFDAANRRLSGTPAAGAVRADLTYVVRDAVGNIDTLPVVIIVRPVVTTTFSSPIGSGRQHIATNTADQTFTMTLDAQPAADVTLRLRLRLDFAAVPAGYGADRTTVVFTPNNWNIPQQVNLGSTNAFEISQTGQYQIFTDIVFGGRTTATIYRAYFATAAPTLVASPTVLTVAVGGTATYALVWEYGTSSDSEHTLAITPPAATPPSPPLAARAISSGAAQTITPPPRRP